MTKKKNDENPIFTAAETANFLALDLGGKEDIWAYRLANWRRSSRKAPAPLQHETAPDGSIGYRVNDLLAFIGAEQSKWLAVAKAQAAARSSAVAGAVAVIDGVEEPHVRASVLVEGSLQFVVALNVRMARRLAASLTNAANEVDKATAAQEAAA